MTDAALASPAASASDPIPEGAALATWVAAKLCHDFISPVGAIMSGLDLLDDPSAQDMRDDAMGLIQQSARKLAAIVHYCRVAFGAATSAESFSADELRGWVEGMVEGGRATMDWAVALPQLEKPAARALVNLAYLTMAALPMGGTGRIEARREGDAVVIEGRGEGPRARFKPEALTGLSGRRLTEGLTGQWIQPYWLWLTVQEAGGTLAVEADEGRIVIRARLPG